MLKEDLKSYWQKQEKPLFKNLEWNFPEQKQSTVSIIGGNSQSFSTPIKLSEYLAKKFPIKTLNTVLPDSLKPKLPINLTENLSFLKSTPSGSFDKSTELINITKNSDTTIFIGDLSKNSTTCLAIAEAIKASEEKPIILTRDTIDLIAPELNELIDKNNLIFIASLPQLQKILRSVYYPKMLLLSQPLLPVIETLHKFTLSYGLTILTFHDSQIIVAHNGNITTTNISDTKYRPLTLWSGLLAGDVAAFNLWNPQKSLEATTAAIIYK